MRICQGWQVCRSGSDQHCKIFNTDHQFLLFVTPWILPCPAKLNLHDSAIGRVTQASPTSLAVPLILSFRRIITTRRHNLSVDTRSVTSNPKVPRIQSAPRIFLPRRPSRENSSVIFCLVLTRMQLRGVTSIPALCKSHINTSCCICLESKKEPDSVISEVIRHVLFAISNASFLASFGHTENREIVL